MFLISMRYYSIIIVLILVAVIGSVMMQTSRASEERVAIILDQKEGVIHFVIDGKEKARLDEVGFHVNGDLGFTGVATDTGTYAVSTHGEKP